MTVTTVTSSHTDLFEHPFLKQDAQPASLAETRRRCGQKFSPHWAKAPGSRRKSHTLKRVNQSTYFRVWPRFAEENKRIYGRKNHAP